MKTIISGIMELNLPNKLTLLRIVLVPVYLVLLAFGWDILALIVFAAASLTDMLDGQIARRRGLVTNFGKFIDPIADKLLVMSALVILVDSGRMPAWVCIVMLAREFIISGFRLVAAGGGKVIAANMWGKVKTVLQMLVIILYYVLAAFAPADAIGAVSLISMGLCWLVAAVTLISGAKYLWDNRSFINTAK